MTDTKPTGTVLVADSDASSRATLASVLGSAGYRTLEAGDADGALALLAEHEVDLVILDFVIGGRPGIEVCRTLRQQGSVNDTPILFLSISTASSSYEHALAAGADDFLTKPIHRGELLLRLRSLICLRDIRRELTAKNVELVAQRDALLRAQARTEELTSFIVHDLKNPLASIAANASFVSFAKEMTDGVREAAEGVERATDDMLRMVHNLLDLSRASDARLVPQLVEVDLSSLARGSIQLMEKRAAARGVMLKLSLGSGIATLRADADLLRRALENLLDNAVRYSPRGGVVTIEITPGPAELTIRVSDQGPGIPAQLRERVFDKYVQLDRAADQAPKRFGRGLGLAFVKLVIDAHRGAISVTDAVPSGTTFQMSLPLSG